MSSYFLRHILHDWGDQQAAAILRTLRAALPGGADSTATLLIQDAVMDERRPGTLHTTLDLQARRSSGGRSSSSSEACRATAALPLSLMLCGLDLPQPLPRDPQMLAICGSKERTLPEWEALLEASGWRLAKLWPLRTITQLLEARPA